MWSTGVVAHILLSGTFPFGNDEKDAELIKSSIKEDKLNFKTLVWDQISDTAKDFVKLALTKNPDKRPNAIKLL